MKLKVPPAVVTAICAGLMWSIDHFLRFADIAIPFYQWIAGLLAAVGIGLGISGLLQFFTSGASIDPHKPAKTNSLVTSGVYRFSRNPMYLGLFCMLLAYTIALQNVLSLLALPLFVWYMNRYQIKPEEEVLLKKFGNEFRQYMEEVRRWI